MKRVFFNLIAVSLLTSQAFATVEGLTRVHLVVWDENANEYRIESAPVMGCIGLVQGPQLVQFTSEYKVKTNVGCGPSNFEENINYLTCAKVESYKESNDFMSFSEITLDISQCEDKNNPQLITMIRTAAKRNFPQKKGEVRLNLKK